jgi:hypothetical protein
MNDILIQYEDLISDEKFESMKPKVFDIKPFEPERLLELIYYWIVVFVTDEDKDKKSNITYFNIKNALEELILKSFKKQGVYIIILYFFIIFFDFLIISQRRN